jgi:MHS family proline/betaine transporter-like MFS transporter
MSETDAGAISPRMAADRATATMRTRVLVAGGIGSVVEFYDFGVYGYLAIVTAPLFFPKSNPSAALLANLAVFATAFVVRPIGSILFGHIGDRSGRKPALVLSVIVMALATFLIGLLPTAGAIGTLAPIVLVIARVAQGLSAGGESAGAATLISEASLDRHRGLMCCASQAGGLLGLLLSSGVVALLNLTFAPDTIASWGWRIPFLLALPTGLIGWYIRLKVEDSAAFSRVVREGHLASVPFVAALRTSFIPILQTFGICAMDFVGYYLVFVYLSIYLQTSAHLTRSAAIWSTTATLMTAVIVLPFFGFLSDRIGRRPVIIGSAIAFLVLTLPMFNLINSGSVPLAVTAQIVLGVCVASIMGVLWATIAELFPTAVRYSGLGFAFSLTAATIGGTTPYIASWLMEITADNRAPAYYLMTSAAVTLITALMLTENAGKRMPD